MDSSLLQNGVEDEFLYDPKILNEVNWEKSKMKFQPEISPKEPGNNLLMRPLSLYDYDKGFIKLLSQLTKVGNVTKEDFLNRFQAMKACKSTYFVTVIEDIFTGEVIGAGSLVLEQKFIHSCNTRGLLEDIVVSQSYRGQQLGKLLVETLTQLAKHLDSYKITLTCKDPLVKFYEQFGYCRENGNSTFMNARFKD